MSAPVPLIGRCTARLSSTENCGCRHYVSRTTGNLCECGHLSCFHDIVNAGTPPVSSSAASISAELGRLMPAMGAERGGPFSVRSGRGRNRATPYRASPVASVSRPTSVTPNSNINHVVSALTGGRSGRRSLLDRTDDMNQEDEITGNYKAYQVFLLEKVIGNTIPDTTSAKFMLMYNRGLIKTVNFDMDGDSDDFERTIVTNFPILREKKWKLLKVPGRSNSKKLDDAAVDGEWTIRRVKSFPPKRRRTVVTTSSHGDSQHVARTVTRDPCAVFE